MAKKKKVISAKEAVEAIKSEMRDEEIMERFHLSARGLEGLFKRLVKEGKIEQAVLHQRAVKSQRTQNVSLLDFPEANVPVKRIDAKEAVKDIRARLSDEEIMEKYGLSARGLGSLFRKLVWWEEISQEELDERTRGFKWADEAFVPDLNSEAYPNDVSEPDEPVEEERAGLFQRLSENKELLSGLVGAVFGMLVVGFAVFLIFGEDIRTGREVKKAFNPLEGKGTKLQRNADHVIRVLKSIVKGETFEPDDKVATTCSNSPECKECMEACVQSSSGDPGLLGNCRKECLVKYDAHIRDIRKHFHNR